MNATASLLQKNELPDSTTCWALVERVAASSQLKRAARLRDVLLYVSRRSLIDGCDQVREQEIGSRVFERPDGYDTSIDTIVRVSTSELRKRITAYFDSEGLHETLIMEIPRGSYIPVFRYRPVEPPTVEEPQATVDAAVAEIPAVSPTAIAEAPRAANRRRWILPALIVAGLIIAAFIAGRWFQNRTMNRSFYAWQSNPSVAAFWSDFLGASPNTDIVLPDVTFSLIQHASNKSFSFNEYLTRSYISQVQDLSPDNRAAVSLFIRRNLGDPNAFRLAQRFLMLDPLGRSMHLYNARDYMPALITRDNVILIGSRVSNPWDELFESRMNFTAKTNFDFETTDKTLTTITNRAPAAGEQMIYTLTDSAGYCVVAYLPNPSGKGKALLIEGTNSEAMEAGGDFLLSEDKLSNFRKMLKVTQYPYFEVLLKISAVKGTPLTATIEAYRTYPNLH
jgi:hypothetical protein